MAVEAGSVLPQRLLPLRLGEGQGVGEGRGGQPINCPVVTLQAADQGLSITSLVKSGMGGSVRNFSWARMVGAPGSGVTRR